MRISSRVNSGKGNADGTFRPQITSLVDVMTILIFFLIKSFSVDSHVVSPPPNVILPVSTSQKPAQPRCAVTITKQEIIADDRVLANVVDVEKSDSLVIAPLFTTMQAMRPVCLADSVGSIIILCDKDVNFAVVKKVMASCSRAGITDFSILVLREGE